jgi:hypothetical protein
MVLVEFGKSPPYKPNSIHLLGVWYISSRRRLPAVDDIRIVDIPESNELRLYGPAVLASVDIHVCSGRTWWDPLLPMCSVSIHRKKKYVP